MPGDAIRNPPDGKLANPTSVQCNKNLDEVAFHIFRYSVVPSYDGTMERQNILSYINLSFYCKYFKYFMSKKFFVNDTTKENKQKMRSNSINLKRREKYYTFLKGIKNQVEFQKNFEPIVIIILIACVEQFSVEMLASRTGECF